MLGQQPLTEALFYYFGLQDQIPEDHLLRLIDHNVDFSLRNDAHQQLSSGEASDLITAICKITRHCRAA